MNILQELFSPVVKILAKGLEASLDMKAMAEFVLYLLGPKEQDSETSARLDKAIRGGELLEVMDGPTIKAYVEKLRNWAEAELKK